jgi:hypothetical protein
VVRRPALAALFLSAAATGGAAGCAADETSVGGVLPAESGLTAEYFDRRNLERPSGRYRDANIDFDGWELNERLAARGHFARTVSIRWTGQIRLEHAETYTIFFQLRGRVRLWIDDAVIVDDWQEEWDDGWDLREPRGTVAVEGATWRDLRIEWDQVVGPMDATLSYASASQPKTVVPATALRHLDLCESCSALPLSAVTEVATSPHGLVVAGVSRQDDLFWDAWLVPLGGGPPRRLAPIGLNLLSVDARGAVWSAVAGADASGDFTYETWLSPSDGSQSVPLR